MGGRSLIVDALATNRILLRVRLGAGHEGALQAASGAEALDCARHEAPGLILIAPALPDMDGAELVRRLRADPQAGRRAVVVLLDDGGAGARRLGALRAGLAAGADDVVARDCPDGLLLARIRRLMRAARIERELQGQAAIGLQLGLAEGPSDFVRPARLGLITAKGKDATRLGQALAQTSGAVRVEPLSPPAALLAAGQPGAPAHFLIADGGGDGQGLALLADLRAHLGDEGAGIVVALADPGGPQAALALDLGADAVVGLPADPAEVAIRLTQLEARMRRIDRVRRVIEDGLAMAATDPLTGLWNRRYALAHLERIAAGALERGTGFAVMLLDLDRFKRINDAHGHAAGDVVLTAVAARMQAALRPSDLLARIGGEEFLVALPDPGPGVAQALAERLCREVGGAPVALPGLASGLAVTLSGGLAMVSAGPPDTRLPEARPGTTAAALARLALERADAALYAAKDEGRNQVVATAAWAA